MQLKEMKRLIEITAHLRSEQGCDWDKKQNFNSMIPHLLEEAYEVVNAIEEGDFENLKEELGDLLFHIVFQARLAEESNLFGFGEIAKDISDKLVRRHPHIFENRKNLSSEEVMKNWEKIKKQEKVSQKSILDGIPHSFGSLLRAEKIQERAANAGFDWDKVIHVEKKIEEELGEFLSEIHNANPATSNKDRLEDEFGDILFSLVNLSRHLGISTEQALNKSSLKFLKRFREMEKISSDEKKDFSKLTLQEKDALWERAKEKFNAKEIL